MPEIDARDILSLVLDSLKSLGEDFNLEGLESPDEETRLLGEKSALDSIALVNLIADLEDRISEQYARDIILADERAMSQTRSPFRRVGSLAAFIQERLNEENR